ncbi:MAG: glycosyltransferase family 2 protein [Lentisphaeria bacterium]|nr:glycosyltransferase family 2 protein [Lentisphaeria bacterium]
MSNDKVFVIIPCYNEAAAIRKTVENLLTVRPDAIAVVIDDGSKDNSVEEVKKIHSDRVVSLVQPFNCGIGTTVETGLLYAYRHNAAYAVKFDGDGQHLAEEIELLLAPLRSGEADLTIGSRFLVVGDGFKSTFIRRIGIKFFQMLCWVLTRKTMTDNTSGFRGYNQEALAFAAKNYPSFDYPEPEENILFIRNKFRVKEVPCKMNLRQGGTSSISALKAVYYMVKVSLAMLMAALRSPVRERKN